MRADTRLGSFVDVAAAAPLHAPTLAAIRALVAEVRPEATEAPASAASIGALDLA